MTTILAHHSGSPHLHPSDFLGLVAFYLFFALVALKSRPKRIKAVRRAALREYLPILRGDK